MRTRAKRRLAIAAALSMLGTAPLSFAQAPADPGAESPKSNQSLSDKLDKSNGVIKPRQDVDPGIRRPPPPVNEPTPVIPPPGTPGGDPSVQPK